MDAGTLEMLLDDIDSALMDADRAERFYASFGYDPRPTAEQAAAAAEGLRSEAQPPNQPDGLPAPSVPGQGLRYSLALALVVLNRDKDRAMQAFNASALPSKDAEWLTERQARRIAVAAPELSLYLRYEKRPPVTIVDRWPRD